MPDITFSISEELHNRMKKFPEIKWSTLYLRTIEQYLEKLEFQYTIPITELREKLRKKGITMDDLTHEQAIENYKKMRELYKK